MTYKATTTPGEIWSLIRETQKNLKAVSASQKDTEQQLKETNQQIRELSARTDQQIKETSKEVRKTQRLFNTLWGRLVESLVEGDLIKHLQKYGIKVQRTSTNEKGPMSYADEKGHKREKHYEIDIVAKNGEEIVIVEVKTTLKSKDVKSFVHTLKDFAQYLPEYQNKKVYGAVAYLRTEEKSARYAEKQGLFVIRATGNSSSIINKKDFQPKNFS